MTASYKDYVASFTELSMLNMSKVFLWYNEVPPYGFHCHQASILKPVGHLTARSDVYSFGVVLLELLTGRKSVDKTKPSKEQNLVDWARPKLNDKRKLLQIIDPRLENQYSTRAAQKACSLAYYCLSQNPKARPLMSDVVETLEPLQSGNGATEYSLTGTSPFVRGGVRDCRMRQRFADNVGPGVSCRSANPNCSPSGHAACRVRWECILGLIFTLNEMRMSTVRRRTLVSCTWSQL